MFKYDQARAEEIILPIYYILVLFLYINRKPFLKPVFWKIFSGIALLYHCYFVEKIYNLSSGKVGQILFFIMMGTPSWMPMLWVYIRYPFLKEIWNKEEVKLKVEMNSNNRSSLLRELKTFLIRHKKWVYLIVGFACNLIPHFVYITGCLNGEQGTNGAYSCTGDGMGGVMMMYAFSLFLPNLLGIGVCCFTNIDLVVKSYKETTLGMGLIYLVYFTSVPLSFIPNISKYFLNLVNQYEWGW